MRRRTVLKGIAVTALGGVIARPAIAQQPVLKIGMSMPMTGAGFNAVGRQLKAAIALGASCAVATSQPSPPRNFSSVRRIERSSSTIRMRGTGSRIPWNVPA